MNLYELSMEAQKLSEILSSEDVSDDMAAEAHQLQEIILEDLLPEKVEGYCHVIAQLNAEAAILKAEEKRLADRRKVRENNVARMKQRLHEALEAAELKKLVAGVWTVNRQKSPPSLMIGTEENIPTRFYVKQDPKLDRKALLDAVKDGLEIDGVTIETENTHVRIK